MSITATSALTLGATVTPHEPAISGSFTLSLSMVGGQADATAATSVMVNPSSGPGNGSEGQFVLIQPGKGTAATIGGGSPKVLAVPQSTTYGCSVDGKVIDPAQERKLRMVMIANKSPINTYGYDVFNIACSRDYAGLNTHKFRLHPGEAMLFKGYVGGTTGTKDYHAVGYVSNPFPPEYVKVLTTYAPGGLSGLGKLYVVGTSYNIAIAPAQ